MSILGRKQRAFARVSIEFLAWVIAQPGHEFTWGETLRGPAQIAWNVAHGIGIARTNHAKKLAMDINLFIHSVYQTETEAYRHLGEKWEEMGRQYGLPLVWGGRFGDGNHFSMEHDGTR